MLNPTICPQCFQPNEPARTLCWKCMRTIAEPALETDYVRIFSLKASWTKEDLRAAFRVLARKYHPDANPGNREADSYFKFVNQAYEVLSRRADANVLEKAEGKELPPVPSAPRADMLSDELSQKLRAVVKWSQAQKAAEGVKKKTTFQKITQKLRFWPFKA